MTTDLAPRTFIKDPDWDDKAVHYFRVAAYNSAGESPFSNEAELPSTPQNMSGAIRSTDTVELSWEPSKSGKFPIAGYAVYRDGLQIGLAPGTRYADAGLAPGAGYAYTVKAFHAGDPALGERREPAYSFAAIAFMIQTPLVPAAPPRDVAAEESAPPSRPPPGSPPPDPVSPGLPPIADQLDPSPVFDNYFRGRFHGRAAQRRPSPADETPSSQIGGLEAPAWAPADDPVAELAQSPGDLEAFISRGVQISLDPPPAAAAPQPTPPPAPSSSRPVRRTSSARQDDFKKNLDRMAEASGQSPRTPSQAQRAFGNVLDQLSDSPSRGAASAAVREDRAVSTIRNAVPSVSPAAPRPDREKSTVATSGRPGVRSEGPPLEAPPDVLPAPKQGVKNGSASSAPTAPLSREDQPVLADVLHELSGFPSSGAASAAAREDRAVSPSVPRPDKEESAIVSPGRPGGQSEGPPPEAPSDVLPAPKQGAKNSPVSPAPTVPLARPSGPDSGRLNAAWSKFPPLTPKRAASPPPLPLTSTDLDRGGPSRGRLVRIARTIVGAGRANGRKTASWMRDIKKLLRSSNATRPRDASAAPGLAKRVSVLKPGFRDAPAPESFASAPATAVRRSPQEGGDTRPVAARGAMAASERELKVPETLPGSPASRDVSRRWAGAAAFAHTEKPGFKLGMIAESAPEAPETLPDGPASFERPYAAEGSGPTVAQRSIEIEPELRDAVAQAAFPGRPIPTHLWPQKSDLPRRPPPRDHLAVTIEKGESNMPEKLKDEAARVSSRGVADISVFSAHAGKPRFTPEAAAESASSSPETMPAGPASPEPTRVGDSIAAFERSAQRPKLALAVIPRRERRLPETMPLGLPPPHLSQHYAPNPSFVEDAGTSRPETDHVRLLIGELAAKDPRSRALAADGLGMQGKAAIPAVDALRNALHDESPRVRASATLALGNIGEGGDEVARYLASASQESNADVRWSAVVALARFTSQAAAPNSSQSSSAPTSPAMASRRPGF